MKRYLLFCYIISVVPLLAQENDSNFKLENNALIWQKTYEMPVSLNEYLTFIRLRNCLENIDTLQNTIVGKLKKTKFNTFELPIMQVPIYIRDDASIANVKIEFKNDKYRVTVSNMQMVSERDGPVSKVGEIINLDTYYYKPLSKTPRPKFHKLDAIIISKNFDGLFSYKKSTSDF